MNLPPLPNKVQIDKHIPSGYVILGYTADQMRKYAEAAVVAERKRWTEAVMAIGREDQGSGDGVLQVSKARKGFAAQDDEVCDGLRGALCRHQDPNNCNRERDCPAFVAMPKTSNERVAKE